jgi:dipeptidyl aminopeptidase/acylaminoacyl peptidase
MLLVLCVPVHPPCAGEEDAPRKADREGASIAREEELSLEELFPEKGLFGPAAERPAFSASGRYAAYLYRPYLERRHGHDLWIYDVEKQASRRVTSVSVMSRFQEAVRRVRDERIGKRRDGGEKEGSGGKAGVDDGFSGKWEGRVTGGESLGLPPVGIDVTIRLELDEDGAVTGTFQTSFGSGRISGGRFDRKSGALKGGLSFPETGMTGTMDLTVARKTMKGAIVLDTGSGTIPFKLTAKWTSPPERTEGAARDAAGTEGEDETGEKEGQDGEETTKDESGDRVDPSDADNEQGLRYGGVSDFVWAPEADELIFTSGGDLYRYRLEGDRIDRLTVTQGEEGAVAYLPDGSGYTFLREGTLSRVRFGSHLVEQISLELPADEELLDYKISPDGKFLSLLTRRGSLPWEGGREVGIMDYRDRFARVRKVKRHLPDDPIPDIERFIYLYSLEDVPAEAGSLHKVFSRKWAMPRDIVSEPEWALDSRRLAFLTFDQETAHVEIHEVEVPGDAGDEKGKAPESRMIYRFLHNGGPMTPYQMKPHYLADGRRLAFITELSGFRHLHVLDPVYETLNPLTRGRFEIYVESLSKDRRWMFVSATKEHPARLDLYRIDLESGEMNRLSPMAGIYEDPAISPDGRFVMANFMNFRHLRELSVIDARAGEQKILTDSHPEKAKKLLGAVPEFFTYENRHGQEIWGYMFKPEDWKPSERRPLLIYSYGGPLGTTKMVVKGIVFHENFFFPYYMARKHGYVACVIDTRGMSGYGAAFEKANFMQAGKPQAEDLVDGVKWFVEHQGVDPERVGIYGWSFGGFLAQMCLYSQPGVFACGIAGAGPTEWYNYNSWVGTGVIGIDAEGEADLEKHSLLPLAKNLEGRLLLVHGMQDDNVLYQDTVRVYRELLEAGKETQVELFLDPTGGHGLGGAVKTLNRMRKYEEFLLRCL